MTTWAIIPVKPLRYGKSRLSHILSPEERARLTSQMLSRTLEVLNSVPGIFRCLVISRDPAALKIARSYGAYTYGEGEKQDLNVALTRAAHIASAQHATGILIIPADLPLITKDDVEMMLAGVAPTLTHGGKSGNGTSGYYHPRVLTICPDHNKDGTNALYISPPLGFAFSYGKGSYERHLQEARRQGMESRIVHAPTLKFDLDDEDDWRAYQVLQSNGARKPAGAGLTAPAATTP